MRTVRTLWSKYWLLTDVGEVRSGLADCQWVRATLYTTPDGCYAGLAECGRGSGDTAEVIVSRRQCHEEIAPGLECIRTLFAEVSPRLERSIPTAEQLLFPFASTLPPDEYEPQRVGSVPERWFTRL